MASTARARHRRRGTAAAIGQRRCDQAARRLVAGRRRVRLHPHRRSCQLRSLDRASLRWRRTAVACNAGQRDAGAHFPGREVGGLCIRRVGLLEVYVERYPELGEKRQVSIGGAASRNGVAISTSCSSFRRTAPSRRSKSIRAPASRSAHLAHCSARRLPAIRPTRATLCRRRRRLEIPPRESRRRSSDRPITVIVDWAAGMGASEPAVRSPLLSRLTR